MTGERRPQLAYVCTEVLCFGEHTLTYLHKTRKFSTAPPVSFCASRAAARPWRRSSRPLACW